MLLRSCPGRHRETSHAYRRQVPLDAVRSRHRSQAIAPGAMGIRPDRPLLPGSRLPCSPPLPLDPEPSESRDCAAESTYCSHPCPNRPAAPAPARSVVTSWKERKSPGNISGSPVRAGPRQRTEMFELVSTRSRDATRRAVCHLRPRQRGRWYEPDKSPTVPGPWEIPLRGLATLVEQVALSPERRFSVM